MWILSSHHPLMVPIKPIQTQGKCLCLGAALQGACQQQAAWGTAGAPGPQGHRGRRYRWPHPSPASSIWHPAPVRRVPMWAGSRLSPAPGITVLMVSNTLGCFLQAAEPGPGGPRTLPAGCWAPRRAPGSGNGLPPQPQTATPSQARASGAARGRGAHGMGAPGAAGERPGRAQGWSAAPAAGPSREPVPASPVIVQSQWVQSAFSGASPESWCPGWAGTQRQKRHWGRGTAARGSRPPLSPVLGYRGISVELEQGHKSLCTDAGQFNLRF